MTLHIDIPRVMAMDGIDLADKRLFGAHRPNLPEGTVVVSADSHISIEDDIFYERAPARLRDRMPRIWKDHETGLVCFGVDRSPVAIPLEFARSMERQGLYDMASRMRDNDADGVAIEIAFPQVLLGMVHHPDLEAKEWMLRIYNEWLAELQARASGRFYGVGLANWWDPAKARPSIEHIKALGLKTYMIPMNPGKDAAGEPIYYSDERSEPFWQAVEDAGLPLCYHIGEAFHPGGRGGIATGVLASFMPFRRNFGELVFGGILDRHPGIQIVFAEAGINWIPGMLQDAEMTFDTHRKLMSPQIKLRPSEYWTRHCHATFMSDEFGLRNLGFIGAEKVMWSSDYPHNEGTHGFSADIIENLLGLVTPNEARLILGGNAIRLFGLPVS
jgi:predicted TIM-barrel fold metal-dependent hydrolase